MKLATRQYFEKHLMRRYSLRMHICAILLATTFSGILFSKIFLLIGILDFKIRYPASVIFAYLVFFICVKLWLFWLSSIRESHSIADLINYSMSSSSESEIDAAPPFYDDGGQVFGGGSSGGGGLTRSFDAPGAIAEQEAVLQEPLPSPGGSSSGSIVDTVGGAADALGDESIVVAVVALAVLVTTVLVSSILVIYNGPTILAEAAFEGLLATSLIRKTHIISDKAWAGSILKATWKPFAVILGAAFLSGAVLHSYYPQAVRLTDILFKN